MLIKTSDNNKENGENVEKYNVFEKNGTKKRK